MSVKNIVLAAAGQGGDKLYVEDVFSTYLYTGNGSTQTITNGIDLAGEGGMVWIKNRDTALGFSLSHHLYDTNRGVQNTLFSDITAGQVSQSNTLTQFNSNGFNVGSDYRLNYNTATYASWTFRKSPKFFDVVTYTGNGVTERQLPHNLGSQPGFIVIKATSESSNWVVFHRSVSSGVLTLNTIDAALNIYPAYDTKNTDSYITVWKNNATYDAYSTNKSGVNYVAYLFAHDAGGFGDTGTDSVVACGSYTGGSGTTFVTLGWEPQIILKKNITTAENWVLCDIMRGTPVGGSATYKLSPNLSDAESTSSISYLFPTATGFGDANANSGQTYIYLAIRRGPMKTPESGTEVFASSLWLGSNAPKDMGSQTAGFGSGYLSILKDRNSNQVSGVFDNLRGRQPFLSTSSTAAEINDPGGISVVNNKLQLNFGSFFGAGGDGTNRNYVGWHFRRAPGFFDVVCYTGTGVARTVNHNLGVAPELMIVKGRNVGVSWFVYAAPLSNTDRLVLQTTAATTTDSTAWNNTSPTADVFTVGTSNGTNGAFNYVAYLFASLPGVSKVGSYTGTGTTQDINCGFTTGARFVMIKRTDSVGNWYVWDTARGIVSSNDPYLLMNFNAGDITTTDYIDPLASGFQISSTAPTDINVSGGSFIFLAIA